MGFRWAHRAVLAVAMSAGLLSPVVAQGLAGPYLAAREANLLDDFDHAAEYYTRAVQADPTNAPLIQSALVSHVLAGNTRTAIALARRLESVESGNLFAALVLTAEAVRAGDYGTALLTMPQNPEVLTPLLQDVVGGWLAVGAGDKTAARNSFSRLADDPNFGAVVRYNQAMAFAFQGELEAAAELMDGDAEGPLHVNRNSILAHAEILGVLGRTDEALAVVETYIANGITDPAFFNMQSALLGREVTKFTYVSDVAQPIAETLVIVAEALGRDQPNRMGLLFARLAGYLLPGYEEAILSSADLLSGIGQHQLAAESFNDIPENSTNYISAQTGRAEALRAGGDVDAATEVLETLAAQYPDDADVMNALGDIYRMQDMFEESRAAYDAVIAGFEAGATPNWLVYYTRGITSERLGEWDLAEPDFRKALELSPDQPWVLNYLGYSLVEKGEKLEEAQAMIERAVEQMPTNGYIVDSLAWVLYRLGKYEEAVGPMERAAELMPVDPIINDHLGDVLWMVGRKREAAFHWSRALSLEPEEDEIARIRRKLEVGLDVVLEEEAAE
ncbi:MAG TPA: tetratricopeptide repeat protein [Paracoccaceae bacterium]|nr:tetratricopeptide repeat protein [Paracoccaceae bacterium]